MTERLAIFGGAPVRKEFLPYGHQWIDDDDVKAVSDVLKTDFITQGKKVDEFERKVAEYCNAKYAVAFSSGTAALHAACAVAGIKKNNEAITTPMTFAASANAIVYCGGKPVFADIKLDTININPEEIRKKITKNTKVIIPVDFAGQPCELDEINKIASKDDLIVIEDAAHSLGAEYKGQKIGGLSDMTVLSFHPVKAITTGEGGMVLTNIENFYEKLRVFRHHGIIKSHDLAKNKGEWYYEIQQLGYNFRLTDFQCALGISQLKKLDKNIKRRREIAANYNDAFEENEEIITPTELDCVKSAYHIYVIQIKPDLLKVGRKEIFDALRAENIGVNVHYIPVHYHPFYQKEFGYKKGDFPNTERYYEHALTLPIFPRMSKDDVNDVIEAVKKVIGYYGK